jgi:hypothetical protein
MSTVPARPRLGHAYSPTVRDLRRAAVAGLFVVTTLLTGCAEKQEARDTLPTPSVAPTTEALPALGPADFPVPDEARTKDEAGVDAFGRYLIELINRQQKVPTGDAIRLLGPQCQDCLRIAQQFDEAADAGQRLEGGELSMGGDPAITMRGDVANFNFMARIEAGAAYDSSGAVVPDSEFELEERLPSGFELAWSPENESWLVSGAYFG